ISITPPSSSLRNLGIGLSSLRHYTMQRGGLYRKSSAASRQPDFLLIPQTQDPIIARKTK
ncbi:MAG: hypothetical protein AAGU32_16375, partial [Bacillota bacterium]